MCVYPRNGPAFYFKRYKRGPLLVGDLDNNIVEDLLDSQMNLFQTVVTVSNSMKEQLLLSFYDIPDVEELRRGREAVNFTLY